MPSLRQKRVLIGVSCALVSTGVWLGGPAAGAAPAPDFPVTSATIPVSVPAPTVLVPTTATDAELAALAATTLTSLRAALPAPLDPVAANSASPDAASPSAAERARSFGESTTVALVADALYLGQLGELASIVAPRGGVDPNALYEVWSNTQDRRMVAVLTAMSQVGTPYKRLGTNPGGFDCSGLVYYSWSQAGVKLTRSSSEQIRNARRIDQIELRPGDIVWRPGHVLLYLGVGEATIDSPRSGQVVEIKPWGRVKRFGSPID